MTTSAENSGPFSPGTVVLVTLASPREKFWGVILSLSVSGIALRGCELNSFEDCVSMVKSGEGFAPGAVFFPMHRVERMEADASSNGLPSLSERFANQTGLDAVQVLTGKATQGAGV
jgi:hypothetical protein